MQHAVTFTCLTQLQVAFSLNPRWVKSSSPLPILSLFLFFSLCSLFVLSFPSRPSALRVQRCSLSVWPSSGDAWRFLVLIGANSSGHLPGLSVLACVRLRSGLTDHSVEGHSSTCPPGQEPGWNNNIQPPYIWPQLFWVSDLVKTPCAFSHFFGPEQLVSRESKLVDCLLKMQRTSVPAVG